MPSIAESAVVIEGNGTANSDSRSAEARRGAWGVLHPRGVSTRAPRLLACDLDGTLLDEIGCLRSTVRAAIGAVRASGVEVVLATGRSPWAVTATALALGLHGPQIVMNGGVYMSPVTREVAWTRRLSPELVIDGLAFAGGLGSSPLLGFVDRLCFDGSRGKADLPDFAVGPHVQRVDKLYRVAGEGPVRVYIPTNPREHARVVAEAVDWFGPRASIVYSDELGIEILAPRTNKGEALTAIAAALKLDRSRVAAIGDGPNDREMLAYAGRSAALLPATGSPFTTGSILGRATEVYPSSAQDGAVLALRSFFPALDLTARPERPAPAGTRPASDGPAQRPGFPGLDDDPEPDMDLTAA
jgi:hydroxymethylpyrimidine pyrophosphatase-like HAD family hydrolase